MSSSPVIVGKNGFRARDRCACSLILQGSQFNHWRHFGEQFGVGRSRGDHDRNEHVGGGTAAHVAKDLELGVEGVRPQERITRRSLTAGSSEKARLKLGHAVVAVFPVDNQRLSRRDIALHNFVLNEYRRTVAAILGRHLPQNRPAHEDPAL
eukprot:scaffold47_cov258-Pinguiococcus_pyrenoidosus.AAC.58